MFRTAISKLSKPVTLAGALLLLVSVPASPQLFGNVLAADKNGAAVQNVTDPLRRTTPRSSIYAFLQACHSGQFDVAAQYLDLSRIKSDQRAIQGPELARSLGQILDRDTQFEVARLSNEENGRVGDGLANNLDKLESFDVNAKSVVLTMERVTRDGLNVWLVAPDSVSRIPQLTATLAESPFEKRLPEPLVKYTLIGTPLWVWLALLLSAAVIAAASRILSNLLFVVLRPFARKYATRLQAHRLQSFAGPLRLSVSVVVFSASVGAIGPSALARDYLFRLLTLLFVLSCASILMRMIDVVSDTVSSRLDPRQRALSYSVLPLFVRAIKISVFCVAALFVLSAWGYNTNAVLAGLGVGGIAVALASQKTIENLFGGISVISDRPVLVGDFCQFGGQTGTVEDIGLRSTRIRTLDRTVVSVPNSSFSTMTLENFSKRDRMWFHPTFYLRRDTQPEQIRAMMDAITDILRQQPKVDPTDVPLRFTRITKDSFDLEVFAYVLTPDSNEFLRTQSELLLKVLEAARRLGVEFAVPVSESVAPLLLTEDHSRPTEVEVNDYQFDRKTSK